MNEVATRTETRPEVKTIVLQPNCDICEEDGMVRLKVEMPGVSKDGIEVSVEKNELVIAGRRSEPEIEGRYLVRERRPGEYKRRFIIDDTIDRDKIEATMVNGVLYLKLNIKEAAKARKIEIS